MNSQLKNSLLLLLGAAIWGFAFVAQSVGNSMGVYAFLAGRSWLAVLVLAPAARVFDAVHRRRGEPDGRPRTAEQKKLLLLAGTVCGTCLFAASAAQQTGISLGDSTAKASFLTAMYVVLVPVFGLAFGHRAGAKLWLCMAIAVCGLYLLCMQNGFGKLAVSDWYLLLCSVLFSLQIMAVDHFSPLVDGVRLSLLEFFFTAVYSTIVSLLTETPSSGAIAANIVPLCYCGFLSSGVAYTLQIVCQKKLNPAVASLIMCMESVFGALGGWLLLGQTLSARELAGCALLFAAVVLAQLPVEKLFAKAGAGHADSAR